MKPKLLALILATWLLNQQGLLATAQIGDYLDFQGKRVEIYTTPLEDWFGEKDDRKRPDFGVHSTACWRGYVALWKISEGKLFLVSLHQPDHDKLPPLGKKFPLKVLFPESPGPVFADWYSGVLRIPEGKTLRYVHMGFGSTYERDRYLTIRKGKVVASKVVDNKGYGATRSTSDLEWVAMAAEPVEDEGNWIDARLLDTEAARKQAQAGTPVTTRGIFFPKSKVQPSTLWIPTTPTTPSVRLEFVGIPSEPDVPSGSHAELVITFNRAAESFTVKSIRQLKAGETIHHPEFKAPKTGNEKEKPPARE